MTSQITSDDELLYALCEKDVGALEELYDRHHQIALAIAIRVLKDRGLAEDVVQEAFLAVWRQAESFRAERGNARSWLLSIVRHRAIDVTRGKAYANQAFSLDEPLRMSEMRLESTADSAESQAVRNLEAEQIRAIVASLPEAQSEAISLAYFGGHTNQEIAEITGAPLGTVKGRIRLALSKLRTTITDGEERDD